jgi:group I intron endonuclease
MANSNKLKKYHFLYKTTNLLNGKFYIGIHSTSNLKDGYLGSGTRLRRSIRRNGKENFKIEYLEFFENRELLVEREKQLVNEDLLKDDNCMNLKPGGYGGICNEIHKLNFSVAGRAALKLKLKNDLHYRIEYGKVAYKNLKNYLELGTHNYKTFKGKSHNEETKRKMSEAKKGKYNGSNNPQYGTKWITNGTENKKIKKEETIPTGWEAGRV